MSPPSVKPKALGAILSQFPRYDEAFILRELTALAQGPRPLVIFSLRPCHDRIVHDQAKKLLPQTRYAPFFWSLKLWRSHAYFLQQSPRAYWSTLGWIVSRHWRHPVILAKTLILFPKMVHFARMAQEQGITHLHAFWATYPATAALIAHRLTGISYSLSGHAHDLYTTNPALVEKLHEAAFAVTCTEHNRQHLLSLMNGTNGACLETGDRIGDKRQATSDKRLNPTDLSPVACDLSPTPCPVVVSYHGVDLERFAATPKTLHAECRILSVGSLFPCKGYETLIEACRLLRERGISFHCTIAGGGTLERTLRRQIARHSLESMIEITGFVSQETVARLYQAADLCVLPLVSKIHWGIPNVLIEALATKTTVIACDLPSMKELVEHGKSGWIIPEGDPKALADAIVHLWGEAPLRQALTLEGYRRVRERFDLNRTGELLRNIFEGHGARGTGQESCNPTPPVSRPAPLTTL